MQGGAAEVSSEVSDKHSTSVPGKEGSRRWVWPLARAACPAAVFGLGEWDVSVCWWVWSQCVDGCGLSVLMGVVSVGWGLWWLWFGGCGCYVQLLDVLEV